ncbi:polyprenol monophosphomannose synthase [Nannocystis sp.]|uniref:polyprenol monophosphomannose synthase n=1 Tax=Nannocystis sp. TaxID=1962667 RepID=UPI002423A992|nr:polyprenol monophosphomannose synthase [Nannocystis sp.]MBK7826680.1 polyprenol monophosphomannose synthase [Nannocystis sp.]MBK9754299.1 polyprenol monophosphomannose synthase [Nannocystis sp.]
MSEPSEQRPLVLIPTYNERENLAAIVAATLVALPTGRILVIDDASPDGTGALADELALAEPRVSVLHRAGKQGLGRAYLDGFRRGLADPWRATHFVSMDADFSHDPKYLPGLLAACAAGADVAIGSRYVRGGGTVDWGFGRRLISRAGGLYARALLGVPVRDVTAGFVCYARAVLEDLDLAAVAASGYGFQIEMKHRAHRRGFVLRELPIVFPDRTRGTSKMTPAIAAEALRLVWRLRRAA